MDAHTVPDDSVAAVAEDLRVVVGRLVRRLRAGYTIPPHQFSVLNAIERGGPQTASQLATAELVRQQSMAHTLQQLVEAGFVTRSADPADGRKTLIGLSERGALAIRAQRQETTSWLTSAMQEKLSEDERRALREALAYLDRLVTA